MGPKSEGPRERLFAHGVQALSNPELLALLLRSGNARRPVMRVADDVWRHFGSWEALGRSGDAELCAIPGLGSAKVASLRAALEIGTRSAAPLELARERILGPEQVFQLLGPRLIAEQQECFVILMLDSRQRLIRVVEISRGSLDQSLVHPREVFLPAIREVAASLVLVHNHPSGDPEPSAEDRSITERLVSVGELLGIPIVDHVVVGRQGYASFSRRGWLRSQVPKNGRR